jgi:hypothetical protein
MTAQHEGKYRPFETAPAGKKTTLFVIVGARPPFAPDRFTSTVSARDWPGLRFLLGEILPVSLSFGLGASAAGAAAAVSNTAAMAATAMREVRMVCMIPS